MGTSKVCTGGTLWDAPAMPFHQHKNCSKKPIMWFDRTACDFQYITVTLPQSAFTISTLSELMVQHKVVIKQRKIQATALYQQFELFPQCAQSLYFIQTSWFSKLHGAFLCLMVIHEASTQSSVAALEVLIILIFSLQAGVFKFRKKLILQNSI